MDRAAAELQFLTLREVIEESVKIPKSSPKTFTFITLTFILPLSLAILAHSLFSLPLLDLLAIDYGARWSKLLIIHVVVPIILFVFSLFSTAAVAFTVASLCTSRPLSITSTLSSIPRVFLRLFITFLFVSVVMVLYNVVYLGWIVWLADHTIMKDYDVLFWFLFVITIISFFIIHVYVSTLWHLASVISVLEPVYGYAAMKKSRGLLKGNTKMGMELVLGYLLLCFVIEELFVELNGGIFCFVCDFKRHRVLTSALVGGLLAGVLVIVNLVGLLVQSVFYYVCKSYHHEEIDKGALYEHLGAYLGEYVPLKCSIELEKLEI